MEEKVVKKKVLVELPLPLLVELGRLASRNERSRNWMIVNLLREGVEQDKKVYRPNDSEVTDG